MSSGRAQEVEKRLAACRPVVRRIGRERPIDLAAYCLVAESLRHGSRVDKRPQRRAGRVLAGEVEEDERLEGLRPIRIAPELVRQPIEDVVDGLAADPAVERGQGRGESAGPDVALVAVDKRVSDLMEQPESDDLAGVGRRCTAASLVKPGGQPARRRVLVDEELAVVTEVPPIEVVLASRRTPDAQLSHRDRMSRPGGNCLGFGAAGGRDRLHRPAQQLQPGRVEVVRPAADPLGALETFGEAIRDGFAR